jgi:hypothetical protein
MTLPTLSPGNSVYVEVDHTGGGTTEYVLYNETTGKSTAFTATWDQGTYAEGGGQDLVDGSTPNNSGTITWEASGTGGWTPTACEAVPSQRPGNRRLTSGRICDT